MISTREARGAALPSSQEQLCADAMLAPSVGSAAAISAAVNKVFRLRMMNYPDLRRRRRTGAGLSLVSMKCDEP
jgi:hypothetical protein